MLGTPRPRALTTRQRTTLSSLSPRGGLRARELGVRSDVLWRLEERGLVARDLHERWYLTDAGRALAD